MQIDFRGQPFILVVAIALSPGLIGNMWISETISSVNATISTLKVTILTSNTTIPPSNATKKQTAKMTSSAACSLSTILHILKTIKQCKFLNPTCRRNAQIRFLMKTVCIPLLFSNNCFNRMLHPSSRKVFF